MWIKVWSNQKHGFFQTGNNCKKMGKKPQKLLWILKKSLSLESLVRFQSSTKNTWVKGLLWSFTNKGPIHSQKGGYLLLPTLIFTSMLVYNQSFTEICLLVGTVSQVSGVAHGPLILIY